jgi:hypothetical protein
MALLDINFCIDKAECFSAGDANYQCTISQAIFTSHLRVAAIELLCVYVGLQFLSAEQIHYKQFHACERK